MRILIYSTQRCGSTAVMNWVSKELDLTPVFEPFIPCGEEDYRRYNDNWRNDLEAFNRLKHIVAKIIHYNLSDIIDNDNIERDFFSKFDKVIVLYRENIRDQAESLLIASKRKISFGDYNLKKELSDLNPDHIEETSNIMLEQTESLLSYNNCFKISYEDIFIRKDYNKLIEYLGIEEPKHLDLFNPKNKYGK
jgi:hypothetical protein